MDNNNEPKLNFLINLNGKSCFDDEAMPQENHFISVVGSEIDFREALLKLGESQQEKVHIKTVIMDSRLDFIASTKKLKGIFNEEFTKLIKALNEKYNAEILAVKQLFRKELVGHGLINMVNAVSKAGWVLVMKENSVNLYKCYNPEFIIKHGVFEDGTIREYQNVITHLRGIYVNILHPKITAGTIHLVTEGAKHPNCDEKFFGAACPGTLEDREIPVTDTKALIGLLNEISSTYEVMHLDSAYYIPSGTYTERKEQPQWTTA
jgi:hypothetical protein